MDADDLTRQLLPSFTLTAAFIRCLIFVWWEHHPSGRKTYLDHLQSLRCSTGYVLRIDHTYKVVKCIGVQQKKKWVWSIFSKYILISLFLASLSRFLVLCFEWGMVCFLVSGITLYVGWFSTGLQDCTRWHAGSCVWASWAGYVNTATESHNKGYIYWWRGERYWANSAHVCQDRLWGNWCLCMSLITENSLLQYARIYGMPNIVYWIPFPDFTLAMQRHLR